VTASRTLAFVVAVLVLLVSLNAEAAKKKKKASKKHKTPAAKHTSKSKSKSKESDRGMPPPESAPETDEASKEPKGIDEKAPPSKKPAGEPADEEKAEKEEKPPAPPPEAEEEGAAKKPAKPVKPAHPAAEPESEAGGPIALSLGVGSKALFRNLTWNQANGALAPYTLSPGPEASIWLEAFPAAFATSGFAGNIGLYGHFDYGLGASSTTPAGMKLTTKYQDFLAGLKIRIPFGSVLPYITGAYGMQKFSLEPVAADRPNFNYSFVSGGAGARIQLNPMFDVDLGAAFLYVLNPGSAAGEVASNAFYPGATANGIDASLSIGVRLISMIGVRAGGDFRQFGLNTHYATTNMGPRAGGATDRNISVWGGVEIVFDGMGGGGGGEEAAPVKKAPPKAKKPPPREVEPEEGGEGAGAGTEGGAGAGPGTDTEE